MKLLIGFVIIVAVVAIVALVLKKESKDKHVNQFNAPVSKEKRKTDKEV